MKKIKIEEIKKELKPQEEASMHVPENTRPISLSIPPEAFKTLYDNQELIKQMAEFRSSLRRLGMSISGHKIDTRTSVYQASETSSKALEKQQMAIHADLEDIEEAFDKVWERVKEHEERMDGGDKTVEEITKDFLEKRASLESEIDDLRKLGELKHQSILKKLREQGKIEKTVEVRIDEELTELLQKRLDDIEGLVKRASIYEYGQQMQVLLAGKLVATVQGINLKNGSNTTVHATASVSSPGFVDIYIDATSTPGGTIYSEKLTDSGDHQNFTAAHTINSVYSIMDGSGKGIPLKDGSGVTLYTFTGTTLTLSAADANIANLGINLIYA